MDRIPLIAIASGRLQTMRMTKRWDQRETVEPSAGMRAYPLSTAAPALLPQTAAFPACNASHMTCGAIPAVGKRSACGAAANPHSPSFLPGYPQRLKRAAPRHPWN